MNQFQSNNKSNENVKYPEMDYFMDQSSSDVVFLVEGQRIPAMKQILCLKSKVFRAMFSGKFKETETKEIAIEDTSAEAFQTLIRFLYCDQLVMKDNDNYALAEEVCKLSDKYQVLRLIDKMGEHLKSKITIDNLNIISRIAFDYKINYLMDEIKRFVGSESIFNQLIRRDINELKRINDSTKNTLFELITSKYLQTKPELDKDKQLSPRNNHVHKQSRYLLDEALMTEAH